MLFLHDMGNLLVFRRLAETTSAKPSQITLENRKAFGGARRWRAFAGAGVGITRGSSRLRLQRARPRHGSGPSRTGTIGQERPVTYLDLWSLSGIDRRIEDALARKENAVNRFREEVQKVRKTNKDSLRRLVAGL